MRSTPYEYEHSPGTWSSVEDDSAARGPQDMQYSVVQSYLEASPRIIAIHCQEPATITNALGFVPRME